QVVSGARDGLRRPDELLEREVVGRRRRLPEAVPGGDAVAPDAALGDLPLEHLEYGPDAREELGARDGAELGLGVVDVVDVDGGDAEVRETPAELVLQVARRHHVGPADDVVGAHDAGPDVRVVEPRRRVRRYRAVEGDVAALRAEDEPLARQVPLALEREERPAEHALAALGAVVDRRVEEVAAEVRGPDDRLAVAAVRLVVLLAEVRAEADRGDDRVAERPEVRRRDVRGMALPEGRGPRRRRARAHRRPQPVAAVRRRACRLMMSRSFGGSIGFL